MASSLRSRQIPVIITFLVGMLFIFAYYFPVSQVSTFANSLSTQVSMVISFTLFLGAITLILRHTNIVQKKLENWYLSGWLLFVFAFTLILGLVQTTSGAQYKWLYANVYSHLDTTMFAILGFYIVIAAFRMFRVKSPESFVLLIVAIFALLGNIPTGLSISPDLPKIYTWLTGTGQMGASYGTSLAAGVATIIFGLRTLTGYEPVKVKLEEA